MSIRSVDEMVRKADAAVRTLSPAEAQAMADEGAALLVDIRDVRELEREGRVPEARHAPRGMLEFWFDPASEYHKPIFADGAKTYILFCAAAGRSALAAKALQDMGFDNVAHMAGGFKRWREEARPLETDPAA